MTPFFRETRGTPLREPQGVLFQKQSTQLTGVESEELVGEEIRASIADVNAPIELSAEFGPVEVLLVSRDQVTSGNLDSWNSPAVYLLISRRKGLDPWSYTAYVGQSARAISRLKSHVKQKKDWHRACVIRKAGTGTFSTSQIAWLEGKIYSLISSSEHGVADNSVKPGDDTLQPSAIQQLENLFHHNQKQHK